MARAGLALLVVYSLLCTVCGAPAVSHSEITHDTRTEAGEPFPPPSTGGKWQWVPIKGSRCIHGASTGVHLKYGPSTSRNVGIYLSGGGACFNAFTCATCSKVAHPPSPGLGGIFDAKDTRNPFQDYHWIHIPYCTGDVHMGTTNTSRYVFDGRENLRLVVSRAIGTWPRVDTLAVTGESAGGFGAAANYYFLRTQWPDGALTHGVMIDDSGPLLDDEAIPPCLQASWRSKWDLNASLPPGCPCIGNKGDLVSAWKYVIDKFPKDGYGLISSLHDAVIGTFFSFGNDDCKAILPGKYTKLEGGLQRLSDTGVPVYMISGSVHTHTGDKSSFYTQSVDGTLLYKWVAQLVSADMPNPGTIKPKKLSIAYS